MNISGIESLTLEQAQSMSIETLEIKGHQIKFVDCGDYFGYSALVFRNGRHIYYANDYELHNHWFVKEHGKKALRQRYIDQMNLKLYTDEELLEELQSYDEYKLKSHYLHNYWIMQYEHHSVFAISEEDKKALVKAKKRLKYFCPVCFCYVGDPQIIDDSNKYYRHLKAEYVRISDNLDEFRKMIHYELSNHEACITCSYTETLDSLGLRFEELSEEKKKIVLEELNREIERYDYA